MKKGDRIAQRNAFGQALVEMADRYPKMVVFDADVCASTQTVGFRNAFPDRFYEMGIAEANMVGAAAGMALCGFTPWVSTFTVFLAKRALDQVRISVAHANLPVKLNASYGGLPTGGSGATSTFQIGASAAYTASAMLTAVNNAIAAVTNYAAQIGATQDRMTAASTFNSALTTNYANGVAGLVDADMNTASTRLQALQTQQQLGIQSLSIANQSAQLILKLFQ